MVLVVANVDGDLSLLLLHPEEEGHTGGQDPAEVSDAAELQNDAGVVSGPHHNQL